MIRLRPPTLWSYIARSYLGYLCVSLFGIITIILSTKLDEIARFIALGASVNKIAIFILCLIPYTLQLALPFASMIAAYVVFHQMNRTKELTAALCCGYPISSLLSPAHTVSLFLGTIMLTGLFDLSATSHLAAKKLEFDVRNEEPLACLQNNRILMKHGIALELQGSFKTGDIAHEILACFPSPTNDRLSLLILKKGMAQKKALVGNLMSVITSKPPPPEKQTNSCSLLIENADEKTTPTDFLFEIAAKNRWKPSAEQFPLSVVCGTRKDFCQKINAAKYQGSSGKKFTKHLQQFTLEPFRRLSLSLAVYTLCLFSSICGVLSYKKASLQPATIGPLLGLSFFAICYMAAKDCGNFTPLAILLYLLPHPILWYIAKRVQKSIEFGME